MAETLKIALAQLNLLVGDVEGNAARMIDAANAAREMEAGLVVFPELALTGYPPEDLLLRPSLHQRIQAALAYMQEKIHGIDAIFGAPIHTADGLYNSALWLRDGLIKARYDKQALPNYSVFDEKRYFQAGHQPCVVDFQGIRVGLTLCEDIWRPEPAYQAMQAGARLLINLNASPFHLGKPQQRLAVLRQRIIETGLPLIYVNLVGGQDELVFDGRSLVIWQNQSLGYLAPAWQEGVFLAALPANLTPAAPPQTSAPATPADAADADLYQALVTGIRDYVSKNGFQGVVLGLSGGIDSALTLALAVDALGAEAVEAVMMPYHYTAAMSIEDATAQAHTLKVNYRQIPIANMVEAFMHGLRGEFAGLAQDVTEENIQARCRGIILMAISNKTGRMVLTTGNKSEMAVGYATLYGDMAGGFAPLKDVSKQWVYRLARYRNTLSPVIPERVITRPPSAELAPGQKDEDSLPPYPILDAILERFVEQDQSVAQITAAGFEAQTVHRVATLVLRNEYKRRQAPPGVRVTERAFGKDRRYPITSGYASHLG